MQLDFNIIRIILVSCLIVILLGPLVIPFLKRLKVGQSIREEGPKSHIVTKSGTPTMGGIIIMLGIIIST
ncbi:MAG TPA: phospho-N-acetylmuramoyl-pentapeptide-transferase, partial [Clostridiales bacterium]|nr:phospho-N-acetylmuramoyl-pentapeptide-transferase [Clostridiales bacterium]